MSSTHGVNLNTNLQTDTNQEHTNRGVGTVMDPAGEKLRGESRNIFSERAPSRRPSATEIALSAAERAAAGVRGRSPRKIFGVFAR